MPKIAIIPARGGSKRIPRKNIKTFMGKPIIGYSIEAALNSGLFDEVMVSTDDQAIANIAKQFGAKVPFYRSNKNADDYATTIDVIEEVINWYTDKGIVFEYGCCVYPCAPFVTGNLLSIAYQKLITERLDCVFPAVRFGFPIQRAVKVNSEQKIEMFQPQFMQTRSQDLEPAFQDAGQFYFFKTKKLLQAKRLWTNNTGLVEVSEFQSQDIDNLVDWELAELKYKFNLKRT